MNNSRNPRGRRFGYWTVIDKREVDSTRHYKWLCRCDCGTERSVKLSDLVDGHSKSCGCATYELKKATILAKKQLSDIRDLEQVDIYFNI